MSTGKSATDNNRDPSIILYTIYKMTVSYPK